jgi:hypothetical protein
MARLSAFALLLLLFGCGNPYPDRLKVHPVTGTVYYRSQPVFGATVCFQPIGDDKRPRPLGRTGKEGSFQLSTYLANDGAPEGEYLVLIVWPGKEGDDDEKDLLGGRYAKPENSPWRITVRPGENRIDPFQIE